ncbi:hypothetical protein BC941DRAFT_475873 [Chlamydoabsidia padenii]|nr:hypothetical protein BC941DRAFT_475873 [Chlamydoabsidia padenii]
MNIKLEYIERYLPSYPEEKVRMTFNNEVKFNYWMTMEVANHATFRIDKKYKPTKSDASTTGVAFTNVFLCDHSGKPAKKKTDNGENFLKRPRQTYRPSIKV